MRFNNYLGVLLLLSGICVGQDRAGFTRDKEFYLKGNTVVIGNSILGKNKSKAFDKLDKANDGFKMRYIDVDKDETTFSSSSAYFFIPETATVVSASLYWTATYYGERSGERIKDNTVFYKKLEERANNPQSIKLKLKDEDYKGVTGRLIYDGKNAQNKLVKSRAPYAYTADVTDLIKGFDKGGDITVANIPATQGKMNGGSSAGWLLYVIYEDNTQPYQYITTYSGLESVKKKIVDVNFGSFTSSKNEELSTKVTVGALEGDSNLARDQISIFNPKKDLFLPFGSKSRSVNNFFNSSITIGNDVILSRNPNSKNTLGFDIAELPIEKELSNILANSTQDVQMQFSTRGDHYFLFFTAFQTTISEGFYNEKTISKEVARQQESLEEKPFVEQSAVNEASKPVVNPKTKDIVFTDKLVEIVDKETIYIPNLSSGFYIISNVFSNIDNAKRWEKALSSKGLFSSTFFRPDNNFYYVSLGSNPDPLILYGLFKTIRQDPELFNSWILKINM